MKYDRPNLLIVGAAKCGTTSLYNYLGQHPSVYFPLIKEPRFFLKDYISRISKKDPHYKDIISSSIDNEEKYFRLFNTEISYKIYGEASVHYLYNYKETIPNIKKYLNDPYIIIILREPVERAVSNWAYNGADTRDFEFSFNNELENVKKQYNSFWYYRSQGMYFQQIKSFFLNFTNVKIIIFEEFVKDPQKTMDNLCNFLELETFKFNFDERFNISSTLIPKNKLIYNLYRYKRLRRLIIKSINSINRMNFNNKMILTKKNLVDSKILKEFKKYYQEDISKLEALLNYDLKRWKLK